MEFYFLPSPSLPHFHPTKNVGQAGGEWGRSNCSWIGKPVNLGLE